MSPGITRSLPLLLGLLFCLPGAIVASGTEPAAQDLRAPQRIAVTSIAASGLERLPEEARDIDAWLRMLLERWRQGYAHLVTLEDGRTSRLPETSLKASLNVAVTESGLATQVALDLPGGRVLEARADIAGHQTQALISALAGDVFYLWAKAGNFDLSLPQPPPQLTALIGLDSLELLPGWRPSQSEPLDIAASTEGPVVLFSDRLLSLGATLEVSPNTGRDLFLLSPFPAGFEPDQLGLNALGEPLLYSSGSGDVLLYHLSGAAESFASGITQPTHFAGLPRGGFALLKGRALVRFLRQGRGLRHEELRLPSGFFPALSGDAEGNLWLYDVKERRVRVLGPSGEEVRSMKPAVDPARLLFPQVFRVGPDGGLLLGGSGELWRFDPYGLPIWRLSAVHTGVRESLPSFFRVAIAGGQSFYLLDPVGRRLFRFTAAQALAGQEEAEAWALTWQEEGQGQPAGLEAELGELFRLLESGDTAYGELVQYCLARGLYLTADRFFRFALPEASAAESGRLSRQIKAQTAQALADLAAQYEAQLLLPESEAALGQGLRLLRELRAEDPVEASYPQSVRELTARRNRLRELLLSGEEDPLRIEIGTPEPETDNPGAGGPEAGHPGPGGLQAGGPAAKAAARVVPLTVRNLSSQPIEAIELQAKWAGLPDGAALQVSDRLGPGEALRLLLPAPLESLAQVEEDLLLRLSLLFSFYQEGREQFQYHQSSLLLRTRGAQ